MAHTPLNTLGKVTLPRANSSATKRLLGPHGQRQMRGKGIEDNSADKLVAGRNKPMVEKVSRNRIATLTPGT